MLFVLILLSYMMETLMIIKELAWNAFKNTGDINVYLEFCRLKNAEESLKIDINETNESKWNNNFGK